MRDLGFHQSTPSPYCGRIDDHDRHPWKGVHGWHDCPGPPTGSTPYLKETTMKYTLNHFEMAEFIYCDKCEALPGEGCRTRSGRRATWPHAARTSAVTFIWTEGFIDGQMDALYAPEAARRWLTKDGYLAATA